MSTHTFLIDNAMLNNGKITMKGWEIFSELLCYVGKYPDLTPGMIPSPYGIFDKLMSRVVSAAQELILIRNRQIYLTYRNDHWWQGWHIPGAHLRPGEDFKQTSQRIANTEIPGISIMETHCLDAILVIDNPRFPNAVFLVKAIFEGEPTGGKWFSELPSDFLGVQQRYSPILKQYLL